MRQLTPITLIVLLVILLAVLCVLCGALDTEAQEAQRQPAEIIAEEIIDNWEMWGCMYRTADPEWIDDCIDYAWWWSKKKPEPEREPKKLNNTIAVWG